MQGKKIIAEDKIYYYFKDHEGRIRRLKKIEYTPRTGYFRLKALQKGYFWWKNRTYDFKNSIISIFFGLSASYVIYKFSMLWSQNDLNREIKSRLPFEHQDAISKEINQNIKEHRKLESL